MKKWRFICPAARIASYEFKKKKKKKKKEKRGQKETETNNIMIYYVY